jgi:hypothetical protein
VQRDGRGVLGFAGKGVGRRDDAWIVTGGVCLRYQPNVADNSHHCLATCGGHH